MRFSRTSVVGFMIRRRGSQHIDAFGGVQKVVKVFEITNKPTTADAKATSATAPTARPQAETDGFDQPDNGGDQALFPTGNAIDDTPSDPSPDDAL